MDAFYFCVNTATTTETRQATPAAYLSVARNLNMQMDHLGVVIGLRRPTKQAYRAGIIPITDEKTEEEWAMIERQLKAVGWKTVRLTESDCRKAPAEAIAEIKAQMGG